MAARIGLREIVGDRAWQRRRAVSVETDEHVTRCVHDAAVEAAVAGRMDEREEGPVAGGLRRVRIRSAWPGSASWPA